MEWSSSGGDNINSTEYIFLQHILYNNSIFCMDVLDWFIYSDLHFLLNPTGKYERTFTVERGIF